MVVRARGAIWLNPFATVLFTVCSAVTVECCVLYPCCVGVRKKSAITERRDMVLYEVPLSLLGFGMGTMFPTSICVVLCWLLSSCSLASSHNEISKTISYTPTLIATLSL